jgi:hypothetical protein
MLEIFDYVQIKFGKVEKLERGFAFFLSPTPINFRGKMEKRERKKRSWRPVAIFSK